MELCHESYETDINHYIYAKYTSKLLINEPKRNATCVIRHQKKCVFPVACLKIIGSVGRLFVLFCLLSNPIVTIVRLTIALSAVKKESEPKKWGRSGNWKHIFFLA
jgi:hypothetical protein